VASRLLAKRNLPTSKHRSWDPVVRGMFSRLQGEYCCGFCSDISLRFEKLKLNDWREVEGHFGKGMNDRRRRDCLLV